MGLALAKSADPDEMLLRGKLWYQEVSPQSKSIFIIGQLSKII